MMPNSIVCFSMLIVGVSVYIALFNQSWLCKVGGCLLFSVRCNLKGICNHVGGYELEKFLLENG